MYYWSKVGVTAPKGFEAAGLHAGLKRKRKDIALISSKVPCNYAGVFTKNVVKAAPVLWNQWILKEQKKVYGVIVNSGNANACTGEEGFEDTKTMAHVFAKGLDVNMDQVLVASTGVIGTRLPMAKIKEGIQQALKIKDATIESAHHASEGIMTTDTFTKELAVSFNYEGKEVTIAGMAKGSGMIHPNMGTMLSFITTDAAISQDLLQQLLKESVNDTYNMISVDGDTSTNDMVLVMANGMSGTSEILKGTSGYELFKGAFKQLNEGLAKAIIKDGEGASKFIEVEVVGMPTETEAKQVVHAVITSNLVKTAFFGEDANWGRILCALGYSGVQFDPMKVDLHYMSEAGEIELLHQGKPVDFSEEMALEVLKEKEIRVLVSCHQGQQTAKGWGCDLSYDYVKINGEYRT